MLLAGDCTDHLKNFNDNSIDLILTDPPYGIEFMGKDWDKALVSTDTWKECYRVLKPGKLAFVMCSPRQDVLARMIIHLQDAGFRTNYTSIYWTYASGFPKAANVSKLIDKKNGREYNPGFREYIRSKLGNSKTISGLNKFLADRQLITSNGTISSHYFGSTQQMLPTVKIYQSMKEYLELDDRFDELIERAEADREIIGKRNNGVANPNSNTICLSPKSKREIDITKPATEAAKKMEGAYVGFQPKPAVEVILVVSKGKTLTWLDDCRIPYQSSQDQQKSYREGIHGTLADRGVYGRYKDTNEFTAYKYTDEKGRFPANLLVSDDVLNDGRNHKVGDIDQTNHRGDKKDIYGLFGAGPQYTKKGDEGSYSRYFSLDSWAKTFPFIITPKASKSERNKGLNGIEPVKVNDGRQTPIDNPFQRGETLRTNFHPTVKPLKLMSYLITLGSREGDIVLDPFCGSGTTCIASEQLHRKWIGIEKNPDYIEIAKKRLMVPLSQITLKIFS